MIADVLFLPVDIIPALIFLSFALLCWKYYQGISLPPGPFGLPIFGYLPFMSNAPVEEVLVALSKKYGNVMSLYFGNHLVIVLGSYDAIKEAYVKQGENFSARPVAPLVKFHEDDGGVANTDGELWREERRFILSTFRDYGMGKLSLEPKVMEEVHCFLDELAKENGQSFDFTDLLGVSTANIIATLEFGKRFDYNDKTFAKLRKILDDAIIALGGVQGRVFYPWLKYLPFSDIFTHQTILDNLHNGIKTYMEKQVKEHYAEYIENSRKDLIDAYFTEQKDQIRKTSSVGYFETEELVHTLLCVFGAGTETTTSTLRWAIFILMIYPDIQKKIQKEIDEVIGMERMPSMTDRTKMVYTEAVLLESSRYGSIVPLNLPHANFEATELFGYKIPKRTTIISNLYAVHHDPALWDNPEEFIPERFISPEGKLIKPDYLIPFGIGKRACLGESLAKMELFLYFTSLLQRFCIQVPKDTKPSLLDYESTFARRPKPYTVCAVQRIGYSV